MSVVAEGAADVIVVGAGVVGIATALQLRLAGMDVLLLDRDPPAAGTSSGNAGALAISEVIPLAEPGVLRQVPRWLLDPLGPLAVRWRYLPGLLPWLSRFVLASRPARVETLSRQLGKLLARVIQDYAPLIARSGLGDSWRRHGALALYPDAGTLQANLACWQRRGELGVRWRRCDTAELGRIEPALRAPWQQQGVLIPDWSHVDDPYLFSLGLFQQFLREGGRFVQQPVDAVRQQSGQVTGVVLANGERLRAGQVVIASGVWSDRFAKQTGQPLPLESERGYHLNLPKAGLVLQHFLLNATESFVILPMANGGLRIAGTVELAHRDAPPDYRRAHLLLDKARSMLGDLGTDGMTAWMGNRPSVPDTVPVIGPSSKVKNLFFACGHGHLGLTLAATTGALLRDHLTGVADIPTELWPGRFR
ncbi:FAD-binding oxidoreductase [Pseudogulbenkiania sp. MAI-1]|uniref:NAD(P)/FAD-dependent oxidoreductase n=1 Tax=Pseudogulbenkiania sp. MAI-1 TaxID=990370 RepID=UPI00045EB843|nr:FAD-dependent oxidoreductase [Pseudogulbenkiania sp. MAI-1]